jgi:hypothetical protein
MTLVTIVDKKDGYRISIDYEDVLAIFEHKEKQTAIRFKHSPTDDYYILVDTPYDEVMKQIAQQLRPGEGLKCSL